MHTLTPEKAEFWKLVSPGESFAKHHEKGFLFNWIKCDPQAPAPTLCSTPGGRPIHWAEPRRLTDPELIVIQSFPDDYNFLKQEVQYVCGMSVPPFMTQRVANQIDVQWLSTLGRSQ
jgi:site-specific DNA-cytosine methylase